MKKLKKDTAWAYVFILVPLCTFMVFTLYPVISAAITSFQEYNAAPVFSASDRLSNSSS